MEWLIVIMIMGILVIIFVTSISTTRWIKAEPEELSRRIGDLDRKYGTDICQFVLNSHRYYSHMMRHIADCPIRYDKDFAELFRHQCRVLGDKLKMDYSEIYALENEYFDEYAKLIPIVIGKEELNAWQDIEPIANNLHRTVCKMRDFLNSINSPLGST